MGVLTTLIFHFHLQTSKSINPKEMDVISIKMHLDGLFLKREKVGSSLVRFHINNHSRGTRDPLLSEILKYISTHVRFQGDTRTTVALIVSYLMEECGCEFLKRGSNWAEEEERASYEEVFSFFIDELQYLAQKRASPEFLTRVKHLSSIKSQEQTEDSVSHASKYIYLPSFEQAKMDVESRRKRQENQMKKTSNIGGYIQNHRFLHSIAAVGSDTTNGTTTMIQSTIPNTNTTPLLAGYTTQHRSPLEHERLPHSKPERNQGVSQKQEIHLPGREVRRNLESCSSVPNAEDYILFAKFLAKDIKDEVDQRKRKETQTNRCRGLTSDSNCPPSRQETDCRTRLPQHSLRSLQSIDTMNISLESINTRLSSMDLGSIGETSL